MINNNIINDNDNNNNNNNNNVMRPVLLPFTVHTERFTAYNNNFKSVKCIKHYMC